MKNLGDLFGGQKRPFLSRAAHEANRAQQVSMTPMTLGELGKYGVTDASQLKLEFFFYTDSRPKADALVKALAALGYEVGRKPSQKNVLVNGWTTGMSMDEHTLVDWTERMCDLGFHYDCLFDGWGTTPDQDWAPSRSA